MVPMPTHLVDLTLELIIVVVHVGNLGTQVGFDVFTFQSHLLQTLVSVLKFVAYAIETL